MLAAARLLHKAGVESFRPERVHKLNRSTNIEPCMLGASTASRIRRRCARDWRRWRDADPAGKFV